MGQGSGRIKYSVTERRETSAVREFGGTANMDIGLFLILPEAFISTGLSICLFLWFVSPQKLSQTRVDVQIGKIDKQTLLHLSRNQRKEVAKALALAALVCALSTGILAWLWVRFVSTTLLAFPGCVLLQLLLSFCLWRPFYRKLLWISQK